ncbi:hypothetical protein RQP46_002906 [Phenoliferia psychrophenolica]
MAEVSRTRVPHGRLWAALGLAFALRVILILWSFYQDAHSAVKYTDIDYVVFTDAARCLVRPSSAACSTAQGPLGPAWLGDPYARDTYRYTPLLAILAIPNITLHPAFAKCVFALADLALGAILYTLLRCRGSNDKAAVTNVTVVWLLNPIIANISTRGSAESVLGLLVVTTLALAEVGRWRAAAALFGLAVHFKVFPIIYGSSLLAAISASGSSSRWITYRHLEFGVLSFASFMLLNAVMYLLWGEPFLTHTFLYHIHRLDHRHNFSPYFYPIYLATSSPLASTSSWTHLLRHPLAAFVPQLGLSIGLGFAFGAKDLAFAWFVQTFAFVTFNKVCTSQYFLWYLWLLPLVLPRLQLSPARGISLLAVWIGGQALWLSQAYRLEMLGEPTYRNVWAAGVVFLVANCWILGENSRLNQESTKVKRQGPCPALRNPIPLSLGASLARQPHLSKFVTAQSLHLYSTSPPIGAQTAKLRSEAVGWMLPSWKTLTTVRFVGNASVWYEIMKHADRLSRLAMRDSCSTFKRLYEELDFDELDLSRVAFNCRYKKRIYALDYRALRTIVPHDPSLRVTLSAVPVLREIRAFGRERAKVVMSGSIFFSLLCVRPFGRPPTLSPDKYNGTSDPSTRHCGIETPAKHTLLESIHYPENDWNTRPISPSVPRIPLSYDRAIDAGHSHMERWTSLRNQSARIVQDAMLCRSKLSREYAPTLVLVIPRDAALDPSNLDEVLACGTTSSQSTAYMRIPVTLSPEYGEYRAWESEALDGEGLDDTFTLEQISQIVAGRYGGPSSKITSWSDNYIHDLPERPRDIQNHYMMLQDLGIGWYLMTASHPELDDL